MGPEPWQIGRPWHNQQFPRVSQETLEPGDQVHRFAAVASFSLLLATAAALPAQSGLGIVAGAASTDLAVDPATPGIIWGSRAGFSGGLSFTAHFGGSLSFAPEALYIQKGADIEYAGANIGSARAAYFEVPVQLRLRVAGSGQRQLFVTAGGQYSRRLDCSLVSSGGSSASCDDVFGNGSGVSKSDYGALFGAGIAFGRLTLSGRYELGLANLNLDTSPDAPSVKSRAIVGMIGISMGR